ncbi:MAG: hypothetical protein R3Y49_00855 [Rikenellaceae bacterium]
MKNTKHEELLHGLSIILFVIGIVIGILCIFSGTKFNAIMFTIGVLSIFGGIIQYAFFRVIIEISLTLKGGTSMYADKNTTHPMKDVLDATKGLFTKK